MWQVVQRLLPLPPRKPVLGSCPTLITHNSLVEVQTRRDRFEEDEEDATSEAPDESSCAKIDVQRLDSVRFPP
jgi:hypothetical protein